MVLLVELTIYDGVGPSAVHDATCLSLVLRELLPQEVSEEQLSPERDDGQDAFLGEIGHSGDLGLVLG